MNKINNTATSASQMAKKYAFPLALVAVFYLFAFLLGNRSICIFKITYGIPCPGCGMTRSFIHLLHGDIAGAFYYHPLFILPIIAGIVLLFKNYKSIARIYKSKFFWLTVFFILITVWAVRMVLMFPAKAPLDFNPNGLFPSIYRLIKHFIFS